jgi:DNA-directed RNA polymerase specialized sigma24 family protein
MTLAKEKRWFLDLPHTCDEVLILLAREASSQCARDELTCRHWNQFKARLPRFGIRLQLTSWDLEDAQQQAFFWIREAIRAFDPVQMFLPQGSSFQTFLNRVLRLRLLDFGRSLRRRTSRFRLVGEQGVWPDCLLADGGLDFSGPGRELHLQLEKAVNLLDADARALWNQLRQGKRLRDLPELLGVNYRTVKRRWRKLREQLLRTLRQLGHQS